MLAVLFIFSLRTTSTVPREIADMALSGLYGSTSNNCAVTKNFGCGAHGETKSSDVVEEGTRKARSDSSSHRTAVQRLAALLSIPVGWSNSTKEVFEGDPRRRTSQLSNFRWKECVCVFSSHSFWTSSSLDVPAGVTQEEGHTGVFIHLLSAVRALIFLARRIQPFLSLVDREVEFCVLTI